MKSLVITVPLLSHLDWCTGKDAEVHHATCLQEHKAHKVQFNVQFSVFMYQLGRNQNIQQYQVNNTCSDINVSSIIRNISDETTTKQDTHVTVTQ